MTKDLEQIVERIGQLPDDAIVLLNAGAADECETELVDLKKLASAYTKALNESDALRSILADATVIEGKTWSISNNGNPAQLIALRQFDDNGNLLSYTHHDTVLQAYAALKGQETSEAE